MNDSARFLFILFLITGSYNSYAQYDTVRTISLDSVVISDSRISFSFSESSRNIDILSGKKITILPARSLPEILRYVPGVDIRQRGPMGVQADVGIRGGSFEQTLVMINGVKLNDPQTGHHNMNLPIVPADIERVEIIKGPGARLYGQDAFSGAVNFITRLPETRSLHTDLYGGDFGLAGGSLFLSMPAGNLKQSLTVSGIRSDGYRENTDFSISDLFYENRLDAGNGRLHLMGGYVSRKFGANGFYADPSYTRQYEEIRTGLASVDYHNHTGHFTFQPRVYFRINRDDYYFVREDPSVYENLHTTDVAGADLNVSWHNSLGVTGIGIETRYESIHGIWTRGGETTPSNLDGFSRNNAGLFIEHRFKSGSFDMTPGIYGGYYNDFGWSAFPGIDMGYSLNRNLRIYMNAGRAFRIPDFYDMYYDSPVEKGNPDLVPEKTLSYELGARYMNGIFSGEVNVFRQSSNNLIDWIRLPVTDSTYYWHSENITRITRTGLEFGTNFDFAGTTGQQAWVRRLTLNYNYLFSNLKKKEYVSRYILENLKQQLILGIEHKIVWQIYNNLLLRYNRREGEKGYWILDARLFWNHRRKPMIYAEVTNITDTKYTEVMTPMPGRWFKIGCSYDLGF